MLQENLDVFLDDFGLEVKFGDKKAKGILDSPDNLILGGHVQTTDYTLVFKTEDFPNFKVGVQILVNDLKYKIRQVEKETDGKFSRAVLTKI